VDYREYKDEKTQLVVLTAAQKFLQDGIESVKMTDLADSCGVGVASLYRYFGTKTAIVAAAGTLLWQDVSKLFEGVFEGPSFCSSPASRASGSC
jgi:AcrR family transcriptional regulator